MSYLEDSIDWQTVEVVDAWLDRGTAQPYHDQPLAQDWGRLSKIGEELREVILALEKSGDVPSDVLARVTAISKSLGKAIEVFIGYTGQNPRKGHTHELGDVIDELMDVVMVGLLCAQHLTKSSSVVREALREKQRKLFARVMIAEGKWPDPAAGVSLSHLATLSGADVSPLEPASGATATTGPAWQGDRLLPSEGTADGPVA